MQFVVSICAHHDSEDEAEKLQSNYHSLGGMAADGGYTMAFAGRNATPKGSWDYRLTVHAPTAEAAEKFINDYRLVSRT